jgi:hypothetical protein
MLQSFISSLFGCSHRRTTFPLTPGRKSASFQTAAVPRNGTYVVCLDCGKEFAYDWNRMQVGQPVGKTATVTEVQPQFR